MSLNELIAQGAQFKTPDLLGQYATAQNLQQGMQQNALNQMKMDEMRRVTDEQNQLRSLYKGVTDMQDPSLAGRVAGINPAAGWAVTKAQQDAMKVKADASKTGADAVGTALKNSRTMLDGITTPEQYMQWNITNYSDPVLGPWLKERGSTPEQALKIVQQALSKPGGFDQLLKASMLGSEKALENHFAQFDTGQQIGTNVMPKYGTGPSQVVQGTVMNKQATPEALLTNARGQEANRIADRRVAAAEKEAETRASPSEKPLTPLQQQKFRKDYAVDADSVKSSTTVASELEKVADELLGNPEKKIPAHPGLGGITGWMAMVKNAPNGDAAQAEQKLETFKGKINSLGRTLATQDGKLGNMAVQEWKIVADAVQNIDPKAGNLDEQMRDVVRQAKAFAARHKERFDLTYENADALLGKKGSSATASTVPTPQISNSVTTPDGQTYIFPDAASAAKFKKQAGL